MSFELILPFLRPIEPLLLDESISEIMGNPDASWWYERDGIVRREEAISFDADRLRTGLEVIAKRQSGEAVWIFRWYEVQLDGTKRYRKAVIGSVQEYKTEAEAQKAADSLRLEINEQTPRQQLQDISMETLVEHYRQHELPDIVHGTRPLGSQAGEDETRKAFSTQTTYAGYLRKWILPRWRSYRLSTRRQ